MKTIYKIPLIAGIVVLIGFVALVIGPIFFMIGSNFLAGFIMSSISDETFEEDFAKIPEVKFFIEKYPDYATNHSSDFLGWKIISYTAKINDVQNIHMEVQKSVLHQGVKISAGCFNFESSYGLNILQDQVMDYLKNDKCLNRQSDLPMINPEKDIPIFFEVMLMEQDIVWEMPQREWNNPDVELEPPARFCSEILLQNGTTVFLSTVFQTPYTLSDMTFHDSLPKDCRKVLPVSEIGKK